MKAIFLIIGVYFLLSLLSFLWIKRDVPRKTKFIIVLSGPNKFFTRNRIKKAAELYKAHYGNFIIVSGKYLAKWMVSELMHFGVKKKDILVQDSSRNTLEDAKYSVKVLKNKRMVILITAAIHQRRANMTFKKFFDGLIVNTPSDDTFTMLSFLLFTGWVATLVELIKFFMYKNQNISG